MSRFGDVFVGRCVRGLVVCLLAVGVVALPARAAGGFSGPDETVLDRDALVLMETKADHADPRTQVYLYTEVLHGMTEMAGRELAAGDEAAAAKTVSRMDAVVAKVQAVSAKNAKRLKEAEELLEHSARRLNDMAKAASGEERTLMQSTLARLNHVHTSVLAMVFAQ